MKMFKSIIAVLALLFLSSTSFASGSGHECEYSYTEETGKGPSKWGTLKPEWAACSEGKLQSPIDLCQNEKLSPKGGDLKTKYRLAPATIKSRGHDITMTWKGDAGKIKINGIDYNLKGAHWHVSSEHAIVGARSDLEFHMVHSNSSGSLAVIGILYRLGAPDPFLSKLLPAIKSITKEEKDLGEIDPRDIAEFKGSYYRYMGSLTTPPCTEGVTWTVLQEARTASIEQVQALRDAVDPGFQFNARPIQSTNNRPVSLQKD